MNYFLNEYKIHISLGEVATNLQCGHVAVEAEQLTVAPVSHFALNVVIPLSLLQLNHNSGGGDPGLVLHWSKVTRQNQNT